MSNGATVGGGDAAEDLPAPHAATAATARAAGGAASDDDDDDDDADAPRVRLRRRELPGGRRRGRGLRRHVIPLCPSTHPINLV